MKDVFIVGYARTPFGSFQGGLSRMTACELGGVAIKAAMESTGSACPAVVEQVIMGCVLTAGLGQAPATTAAQLAGLSPAVSAYTINKVCSSGMKAIHLGAAEIAAGLSHVIVVGGMESMSQAPMMLPHAARAGGMKFGAQSIADSLQVDGLVDVQSQWAMGLCAEKCAKDHNITREMSDAYARTSFERAMSSAEFLKKECTVTVGVTSDEAIKNYNPEKMPSLRTTFKSLAEGGTVTAGNASPLSDGAAALVLASAEAVDKFGFTPLARILAWSDASQAPVDFCTTPALAIERLMDRARYTLKDIDCFEINEAFSIAAIANMQILGLDPARVNVHGGAVSLGHPLGASGARIVGTLANTLAERNLSLGVAAVCNGGGGASAILIQNVTESSQSK